MQFLLDHLSAAVVGGGVLLLLAVFARTEQGSSVEAAGYHANRVAALAVSEQLTSDLRNLGMGVPAGSPAVLALEEEGDQTVAFEFVTAADAPFRVRYRLVGAGDRRQLRREVHDGTAFVPAGPAIAVEGFRIDLLDDSGATVVPHQSIVGTGSLRALRVRVETTAPYQQVEGHGGDGLARPPRHSVVEAVHYPTALNP